MYQTLSLWYYNTSRRFTFYINATSTPTPKNGIRVHPHAFGSIGVLAWGGAGDPANISAQPNALIRRSLSLHRLHRQTSCSKSRWLSGANQCHGSICFRSRCRRPPAPVQSALSIRISAAFPFVRHVAKAIRTSRKAIFS